MHELETYLYKGFTLKNNMMSKDILIDNWRIHFNFSEESIRAFKDVPRENFVVPEFKHRAYDDIALPTLKDQTISQPTTVMIMTNALEVKTKQKILEIGTGSGYQTAILSKLVGPKGRVYTVEIVPELIKFASKNLQSYSNIKIIKPRTLGYKKEAPYDRVIVTAAAKEIPYELFEQLKPKGIMVIPVGPENNAQSLLKIKKNKELNIENLGDFIFVPLKI